MPSSTIKPFSSHHLVAKSDVDTRKLLNQAVKQKDYPRAINLLNDLINQEPRNPIHYSNRGLIYYHCKQWLQAIDNYNQALRLNPNEDRIYTNRAKCSAALGHWSDAIADYDCAIDINPYNIKARIHQGILFRTLKMYDDAIVCFGLALFLGKLSAHIYAERGRTYHLDGHWNCAVGDYQRALVILKQSPQKNLESQIQVWLGELLLINQ